MDETLPGQDSKSQPSDMLLNSLSFDQLTNHHLPLADKKHFQTTKQTQVASPSILDFFCGGMLNPGADSGTDDPEGSSLLPFSSSPQRAKEGYFSMDGVSLYFLNFVSSSRSNSALSSCGFHFPDS